MFQRYSNILFNQSDNMSTVHRECPYGMQVRGILPLGLRVVGQLTNRVCVHQPKRVGAHLCAIDTFSIEVTMLVGVFI